MHYNKRIRVMTIAKHQSDGLRVSYNGGGHPYVPTTTWKRATNNRGEYVLAVNQLVPMYGGGIHLLST